MCLYHWQLFLELKKPSAIVCTFGYWAHGPNVLKQLHISQSWCFQCAKVKHNSGLFQNIHSFAQEKAAVGLTPLSCSWVGAGKYRFQLPLGGSKVISEILKVMNGLVILGQFQSCLSTVQKKQTLSLSFFYTCSVFFFFGLITFIYKLPPMRTSESWVAPYSLYSLFKPTPVWNNLFPQPYLIHVWESISVLALLHFHTYTWYTLSIQYTAGYVCPSCSEL